MVSYDTFYLTGSSKGIGGGVDFVTMKHNQSYLLDHSLLLKGYYNSSTNINVSDTIKVFIGNLS
ncbi:MAG: hypothetical protein WAT71_14750 [Ignavibacteria bacterium]